MSTNGVTPLKGKMMELRIGILLLALGLLIAWANSAHATNRASFTTEDGVTIVLTDEPCKLNEVKNLPYRATWTEKGKTFEGCAGGHPAGLVLFYFSDRTVGIVPMSLFQKMTES